MLGALLVSVLGFADMVKKRLGGLILDLGAWMVDDGLNDGWWMELACQGKMMGKNAHWRWGLLW